MKIIDLSYSLYNGAADLAPPEIKYFDHRQGAVEAAPAMQLTPEDFEDGKLWASEQITLSTHTGTHVDAPYHFGEHSGGKPAKTIDEVPLEWCFGDGVVLDFSWKNTGEEITVKDLQDALDKINYKLKPGDIVLIRTDVWKRFGEPNYWELHPGMTEESTLWLIDQGIKMMGIDAWGWDIPFTKMIKDYKQGKLKKLWAAHLAGKQKEYCHIEKLTNLNLLPPYGFKVACFPVKIAKASGGWARVVAIIE